jgi:hypothetical protein
LGLAHVAYGAMPFLSLSLAHASRARRPPSAPPVGCPWRMAAQGSGSGYSSLNKLVWQLIWARLEVVSHGFFGYRGDGRKATEVLVPNLFKSVVASETGLRYRIGSKCSSCSWCLSSSTRSGEALAPTEAMGLRCSAAGFLRLVVDCSGRRAASWSSGDWRRLLIFLPAKMPKGRQFRSGLAFASSFSGKSRRRSGGEINVPSGIVPGDADLGSSSLPGRRTRLRSSVCVQGLFYKVLGPTCNFIFRWGPVSCTQVKYQ